MIFESCFELELQVATFVDCALVFHQLLLLDASISMLRIEIKGQVVLFVQNDILCV